MDLLRSKRLMILLSLTILVIIVLVILKTHHMPISSVGGRGKTSSEEVIKSEMITSKTKAPDEGISDKEIDKFLEKVEKLLEELPEEPAKIQSEEKVQSEGQENEESGKTTEEMKIAEGKEEASESEGNSLNQDEEEHCPTVEEILSTVGLIPPEETIRLINLALRKPDLLTEEELTTLLLLKSEISKAYFPEPERVVIDKRSGTTKYYLLPAGKYNVDRDTVPISKEEAEALISQGVGTVTLNP
ncbi:hypothetical protein J7M22_06570 [Candidatus Poribacteria bacterium]|nr:hypothetical protein [Candidatus Poribacteria bacterium]